MLVITLSSLVALSLAMVFGVWPVASSVLSARTVDGSEVIQVEAEHSRASLVPGEFWQVRRMVGTWWQPWQQNGSLGIRSPDAELTIEVDTLRGADEPVRLTDAAEETLASGLTLRHAMVDGTLIAVVTGDTPDAGVILRATADDLATYRPALSQLVESVSLTP